MELATGPLPSRAPTAMPGEHPADPWGDFLKRVLVATGLPRRGGRAVPADAPSGAPVQPASAFPLHGGQPAE